MGCNNPGLPTTCQITLRYLPGCGHDKAITYPSYAIQLGTNSVMYHHTFFLFFSLRFACFSKLWIGSY